jgi:hypothetical protein
MPDDTTIADDTTRTLPPSPQAKQPKTPHSRAPRWPLAGRSSGRHHGSAYSRNARPYAPPLPPHAVYTAPRDRRVYDAVRRHLPRFHVIHVVLLAGVGALWLAITLPWGSDAAGAPIKIQQFSIPRISDPSVDIGQLAQQTATWIAVAAVIMAVALLLINFIYTLLRRLLHRLGLNALAAVVFIPLFALLILLLLADLTLAAGFGGLSLLSQLPFVRDHGFASIGVAHAAFGFYLWWIGIGATLIGTLGEIFIDRR